MSNFHITVIQVGKTKASYIQEAEHEYKKRLGAYAKVEVITLKDAKIPKNPSPAQKEAVKREEGTNILKSVPAKTFLIALDEKGKQYTSVQFADFMGKRLDKGAANITFLIGGCYGLSEEVRSKAELLLSFSSFTFTHEMIRALLYEQLFRVFTLIKGKKYHH